MKLQPYSAWPWTRLLLYVVTAIACTFLGMKTLHLFTAHSNVTNPNEDAHFDGKSKPKAVWTFNGSENGSRLSSTKENVANPNVPRLQFTNRYLPTGGLPRQQQMRPATLLRRGKKINLEQKASTKLGIHTMEM
ncbi:hypothetical protein Bbelb_300970 [Branchiostoma belcheri]|nr:hypothetical protein Bbelb_300970 [Branchiostoma belcheri]